MNKKISIIILITTVLLLSGCNVSPDQGTAKQEQIAVEENQVKLRAKYPVKPLDSSLELENLNRRLEFINNSNKVSYIYLVDFGKVMAFYTIRGKVSSVNSYSTASEQIVDAYGNPCGTYYKNGSKTEDSMKGWRSDDCYVVESPDLDGSYGNNGDGVFFFTTEGAYIEWKGDYMVSSQPLKLQTPPELVREIK